MEDKSVLVNIDISHDKSLICFDQENLTGVILRKLSNGAIVLSTANVIHPEQKTIA